MTENEQGAIEGQTRRKLRESKRELECLEIKRDNIVADFEKLLAFVKNPRFRGYSVNRGRLRFENFKPMYHEESEIIEWIEEHKKCTKRVKKLDHNLEE